VTPDDEEWLREYHRWRRETGKIPDPAAVALFLRLEMEARTACGQMANYGVLRTMK
jgi:hypothetical protein